MSGKGEPFTCAVCHGTLEKGRSDEEAMAEARSLYPARDLEAGEPGITCDSCFQKVMAWARLNAPEHLL
jgi:hypothetical protein